MSNWIENTRGAFMKKYAILLAALAVVLMAGCEGDDPSGGGGTLATVTGLEIDTDNCAGRDIVINWTAVEDAEEYEIYFSTSGTPGAGDAVTTTTNTTFTHTDATSSGYYSVRAKDGDNYSESFATAVNTMPTELTTTVNIYDNYAPSEYDSGIRFTFNGAETGLASSASFNQDLYAYEPTSKGDTEVQLRSGDEGPYNQGGKRTEMYEVGSTYGYPTGSAWTFGDIVSGDVICGKLFDGYWIKVYIDDIQGLSTGDNATEVTLHYEMQNIQNVSLFTTKSS